MLYVVSSSEDLISALVCSRFRFYYLNFKNLDCVYLYCVYVCAVLVAVAAGCCVFDGFGCFPVCLIVVVAFIDFDGASRPRRLPACRRNRARHGLGAFGL